MKNLFLFVLPMAALAQDFRSTVQGTITDPTGAAVVGAAVVLKNAGTGAVRNATAGDDGFYAFQFLAPGDYELTVSGPGFRTVERKGLTLALTQTLREDVTLQLGDTTETVTVAADVAMVEPDSTALGTAIRQEIRDNLPLKGRSSLFMFTLTPGVVNNRYGEDTRPNDTITNVLFSANGGPVAATDVFVDGASTTTNVNRGVNISQWVPAVDSIAEYKLEVGTVPAEFGRSGGSATNMVVKSGTNRFHGTAYNFLRNSALDANLYFARGRGTPLAAFSANTFGVAAGGPVWAPGYDGRDRTFWFASFEGAREGNGLNRTASVPTARMRAGDFSEVSAAIYDPYSVATQNGAPTRTPFAGNIIPATRQDPVARAMMPFFPEPNQPASSATQPWVQNFGFSAKWPRNYNMFVTKIDHRFSEKLNTFLRLNIGTALLIFPHEFDGIASPGRNIVNRPHFGVSWGNTLLINSRTTFDVRLGFSRAKEDNLPYSNGFDLTSLGFPASYVQLTQMQAFPTIRVTGFQGLAGSPLIFDPGQTWSLQTNASQQRGRHVMKAGIDFRLLYGNFFRNVNPSGSFSYGNAWSNGPRADTPAGNTGFPMASFMLGLGSGSLDNNTGVSILNKYYGFFFQDDWRVTNRLTLNVGLRYEYETPRTERYDRTTRGFDRTATSPIRVPGFDLHGGLVYAAQGGLPRGIFAPDRNNFAPRVGFAYSLNPQTILRGGYALHYVPVVGSVDSVGYSTTTTVVTSEDGITPKDRLSNPFPSGLLQANGNAGGLATLVGQNISFVEPEGITPKIHTWNFNIQRELFSRSLLQIGYIGSRGINLTSEVAIGNNIAENLNQVPSENLRLGRALLEVVPNPFFGVITAGPLAGRNVQRQQLLRPYPQFQNVTRNLPRYGNSVYHSLQTKFEQRMWKGVTSLISYTYSKNIGDLGPYQDHGNRRIERAPMAFDVPHRLTTTVSWDVPVGRGRGLLGNASKAVDLAVGQWNIAMFNTFQSGFPLSFGVTQNTLFLAGAGGQRPNVIGDPSAGISGSVTDRINNFFNTAAFAQPADFTFGNLGPRVGWLRNPGMNNFNLTLTKQFVLTERFKLNLRASSFNLMNHPVFGSPNTTLGAAGSFGRIFSQANLNRQTEIVLRLFF
ncbi:MAG: TonB-dependent receptor [Bryobacteraceae bacterium]